MNENIYQNVFDTIQDFLPDNWCRIAFYAGYTEGSYIMKFYVDSGCGYDDCFNICSDFELIKLFKSIDKILSAERKKLDRKNMWTVFSMFISSSGDFNTKFDYVDISENSIDYENHWKEIYLK